jgi:hypothetical protein
LPICSGLEVSVVDLYQKFCGEFRGRYTWRIPGTLYLIAVYRASCYGPPMVGLARIVIPGVAHHLAAGRIVAPLLGNKYSVPGTYTGVRRNADNQVIGSDGRTRMVVESERRPNGTYHRERVKELEACGIECQTRVVPPRQ